MNKIISIIGGFIISILMVVSFFHESNIIHKNNVQLYQDIKDEVKKDIPCNIKQDLSDIEIENNNDIFLNIFYSIFYNINPLKKLKHLIMDGQPNEQSPPENKPFLTIINKKNHKIIFFPLTSYLYDVYLEYPNQVDLITKKENPLQIELWVDTPKNIRVTVVFKDRLNSILNIEE